MTNQEMQNTPKNEEKLDFLEKRGFTWSALVVLLVVTLIAALVLAYFITVRNFPGH
jgi:p-aminobenzoyl-glutamate transporter AbgT